MLTMREFDGRIDASASMLCPINWARLTLDWRKNYHSDCDRFAAQLRLSMAELIRIERSASLRALARHAG